MATLNNLNPIQGIVELIPNIKDKIEETTIEYNNYFEVYKNEKFEENENEGEEEAIKRAESIYDRLDEMRRRNQIVLKNGNETIDLICNVKNKMENVVRICESDEIELAKTNNDLIEKIIGLEERKMKKGVEVLRRQIDEMNRQFNTRRNEWNTHKTNIEDISKKQKEEKRIRKIYEIISVDEMKQIEEWTRRKVGNIIFNSDIDNWNQYNSVFDEKIINKRNLIFIIEGEDGYKFGGYVNASIEKIGTWISDSNAFVFSSKSNGRLNGMLKFDIKDSQNAFWVNSKTAKGLFGFDKGNGICIYKEDNKNESCCKQSAFDYNGIENALCGKEVFIPLRITVIQMEYRNFTDSIPITPFSFESLLTINKKQTLN